MHNYFTNYYFTNYYSFKPYELEVWLTLIVMLLATSCLLWLVTILTPYYHVNKIESGLENLTLMTWNMVGSIVNQGNVLWYCSSLKKEDCISVYIMTHHVQHPLTIWNILILNMEYFVIYCIQCHGTFIVTGLVWGFVLLLESKMGFIV